MSVSTNPSVTNYLITSREFPKEPSELEPVLSKSYVEIAQAVNVRTIGTFNTFQIVTGDRYYNTSNPLQLRQSYRTLFTFGAVASGASTTISFNSSAITESAHIYGNCITADNTTKFRCIPYASATDVTKQIQIDIDTTASTIIITNGAGAPNILSGNIIFEYMLN